MSIFGRKRDRQALEYYSKTYLHKQGGTTMTSPPIPSYDLRSFDGGKNWYAVESTQSGGVNILGRAEQVYPGLLEHLQGMEELRAHVAKHGPITGLDEEGLKELERVGFTVERQ